MRFALLLICLFSATSAHAFCRQALVLALDVSGSVNNDEYYQQINGLSAAFQSPKIINLLLQDPDSHVSITAFEWSSQNHQSSITPWIDIRSKADLDTLAARIKTHRKQRQGLKTALGRAMEYAAALMSQKPDCPKQTVDISGDGENNVGPVPQDVYSLPAFQSIIVNALVIGDPGPNSASTVSAIRSQPHLRRYFETEVIHGPGAFTEIALGFEDYQEAMVRKLARELALPVFGAVSR